jgi:clan AA aspartic protease
VITGRVLHHRPTLVVAVVGPDGAPRDFEAIVDTGFTGHLTLPAQAVATLRLPFVSYYTAGLADGSRVRIPLHEAAVVWHGAQRTVPVLVTGNRPLIGMSLIYGSRLTLEGIHDGVLNLDLLP